jgi:CxxC-x17-CxxC domain-containing protein
MTRASPGPDRARSPPICPQRTRPSAVRQHAGPTVTASERREGPEIVYQDRTLTCRDCSEEFTFSAGEQAFYASKSLVNDPQRCPSCRAAAKRARNNEGPREFHAAICGSCGGQAVVPFAPRNDRPVYCSSCFDKVRAGTLETPAHV